MLRVEVVHLASDADWKAYAKDFHRLYEEGATVMSQEVAVVAAEEEAAAVEDDPSAVPDLVAWEELTAIYHLDTEE